MLSTVFLNVCFSFYFIRKRNTKNESYNRIEILMILRNNFAVLIYMQESHSGQSTFS